MEGTYQTLRLIMYLIIYVMPVVSVSSWIVEKIVQKGDRSGL